MLYLIATPIGTLSDITLRGLETLKKCALILAEDTKKSLILLRHYEISTPLESYHQFNEAKKLDQILRQLREGKEIALISDAGTPGVCDPGARLVSAVRRENLPITSLPGPCALAVAMSLSGNEMSPTQFVGFLPKKEGECRKTLLQMLSFDGASYAYESPHHLKKTLQLLHQLDPDLQVTLFKELTKFYEEVASGSPEELLIRFALPKGEYVIQFYGSSQKQLNVEEKTLFDQLTGEYHLSPSQAVKLMSSLLKKNRKELYQTFIHND
ncbi:MAG: 16S rRNA (cytidine(1402)-2'-O)-methyltransferase [Simkaniaceae bacterium]|nr:16S rRNA (cytidine(1402)-2'-O)-methyltransferase [Simkaniaceae bacterium]